MNFSTETFQAREWDNTCKIWKEKKNQLRILHMTKLSINEGDKDIPKASKSWGSSSPLDLLQEMLRVPRVEVKGC